MGLVPLADDAYMFLVCWEFMSLASWALVMAHHREAENARAGFVYIVMASFGVFALLLAFGLLAGVERRLPVFAAMRAASPSASVAAWRWLLALIGAGSKAGLAPLHVWLPLAHPAAPSHVSALMSGVMTKVAVYAFVRIAFDLGGADGLVLERPGAGRRRGHRAARRALRADAGRSQAPARLLRRSRISASSSSVSASRSPSRSSTCRRPPALAMTAALLHVFNHSLFKSLLFFGAGAVLTATGERDMERLGGLIHRMPRTAFAFLVGCVAISALPPLNGFVSEWLTFQAILLGAAVAVLGTEIVGARGRRPAGALGGARRRMLRQDVRHCVSRAPSHERGRSARARPIASH